MVVFGVVKDLLFKSVLGHCEIRLKPNYFKKQKFRSVLAEEYWSDDSHLQFFVCRINLALIYDMKFNYILCTLFMLEIFFFPVRKKAHCVKKHVGMWCIKVHVASFNITTL